MNKLILSLALLVASPAIASDNACDNLRQLAVQMDSVCAKLQSANPNEEEDIVNEMNNLISLQRAYQQTKPFCSETKSI